MNSDLGVAPVYRNSWTKIPLVPKGNDLSSVTVCIVQVLYKKDDCGIVTGYNLPWSGCAKLELLIYVGTA